MFHRRKLICNRSGIIIIIIIILNFIITYHNIHDLIHFFVDIQNAKKPKNRASDIESGMAWLRSDYYSSTIKINAKPFARQRTATRAENRIIIHWKSLYVPESLQLIALKSFPKITVRFLRMIHFNKIYTIIIFMHTLTAPRLMYIKREFSETDRKC